MLLADSTQWIKAANAALNDFRLDFGNNVQSLANILYTAEMKLFLCCTNLAIRIYRHLGDISMVWSLEEIKHVEDLQLLSGHIYVILGNLEKAQVRFAAIKM